VNQLLGVAVVDFAAQIVDINGNHVRRAVESKIPDVLNHHHHHHEASDSAAGVERQVFEKRKFLPVRSILLRSVRLVVAPIELEVARNQH
jgi:hypothetical protein